jgi:hypothetical protein
LRLKRHPLHGRAAIEQLTNYPDVKTDMPPQSPNVRS